MMLVLYPDLNLCVGCKTCEIACAIEHSKGKNLISAVMEGVKPRMDVVFVGVPVPMNCRHCIDAPCLGVCPTDAIERSSKGPVIIDQSKCIGCRSCAIVCPFGAIRFERTAFKCDQCVDRLEKGKIPACVEFCPVGALKFEKVDELSAKRKIEAAKFFVEGKEEAKKSIVRLKDVVWFVRW